MHPSEIYPTLLFSVFPENISTYGEEIDKVFWLVTGFVGVAFIISLFILIYPLFKYGKREGQPAEYITGEKRKNFRWISLALIILALSDFIILFAEHDAWAIIESDPPPADLHIGITGKQWNWIFIYPGPDGKLNTLDDVYVDEMNSELHVPVNKNIVFDLRARDVLHSFFVPNMRLKQDAIPGRTLTRWFNVTKEGKYEIICAEICGVLHSKMRNFLVVESQEKFDMFIREMNSKTDSVNAPTL